MLRHHVAGMLLAVLVVAWPAFAATTGCRYVRPDDAERARRAAQRALVEALCAPPPPDAPPVERAIRVALCTAATAVEAGGAQ